MPRGMNGLNITFSALAVLIQVTYLVSGFSGWPDTGETLGTFFGGFWLKIGFAGQVGISVDGSRNWS